MTAYYNENDHKAATWLRELIRNGHVASGTVDERSIEDVTPSDLVGFAQCHFFAGIGGWSYALRLAGWPDDQPVWTGSCPCQPFSAAGKGGGFADERHLWPAFGYLIGQLHPTVIFGEQVASPAGLKWLDVVSHDLERAGYGFGAADLCAAGVGAPHLRQRLYWVAHSNGWNSGAERVQRSGEHGQQPEDGSAFGWLEYAEGDGRQQRRPESSERSVIARRSASGLVNATSEQVGVSRRTRQPRSALGKPNSAGLPQRVSDGRVQQEALESSARQTAERGSYVDCRDGKRRPVEPGTFPLAHGVPGRVGLLRGYGNAIVPQVAAAFIGAYVDVTASI